MPANLPPQYFDVEKRLKETTDPGERKEIYEELLAIVPKHKGTEKLQALFKTKIAKLKVQMQKRPAVAHRGPTYSIEKSGAGQVVLIGPPNAGKSRLLKALTNADPVIADYPFSTHTPAPAMMPFENIQIQLIDTPPITPEYIDVWHTELVKNADAALLVLNLGAQDPRADLSTVLAKLEEKRIMLVDDESAMYSSRQIPSRKVAVVANKKDLDPGGGKMRLLKTELDEDFLVTAVSAETGDALGDLKYRIFQMLCIVRIYSKIPGKEISRQDPYVLPSGSTLMDMAKSVHKDFAQKLKFAKVWGGNKYRGLKVTRDYLLQDEDIIELHI